MPQANEDFQRQKQQAAEQLLKMSKTASADTNTNRAPKKESALGGILPFLNINSLDNDTFLILGILLILMGERKDNLLILTLFYILI